MLKVECVCTRLLQLMFKFESVHIAVDVSIRTCTYNCCSRLSYELQSMFKVLKSVCVFS